MTTHTVGPFPVAQCPIFARLRLLYGTTNAGYLRKEKIGRRCRAQTAVATIIGEQRHPQERDWNSRGPDGALLE